MDYFSWTNLSTFQLNYEGPFLPKQFLRLRLRDFNVTAPRLLDSAPFAPDMHASLSLAASVRIFVSCIGAASQITDVDLPARKTNMICEVQGCPAYNVTSPTWSNGEPAGTALTGAALLAGSAQLASTMATARIENERKIEFMIPLFLLQEPFTVPGVISRRES